MNMEFINGKCERKKSHFRCCCKAIHCSCWYHEMNGTQTLESYSLYCECVYVKKNEIEREKRNGEIKRKRITIYSKERTKEKRNYGKTTNFYFGTINIYLYRFIILHFWIFIYSNILFSFIFFHWPLHLLVAIFTWKFRVKWKGHRFWTHKHIWKRTNHSYQ